MKKTIKTYIKPEEVASDLANLFHDGFSILDADYNIKEFKFEIEDMCVYVNETGVYGQFHQDALRTKICAAEELDGVELREVVERIRSTLASMFDRLEPLPPVMKRGMFFYGDGGVVSYRELVDDYFYQVMNIPRYTDITFRQWLEDGGMSYLPKLTTI